MEALPGKKNLWQKLGDGIKNVASTVVSAFTPGTIPAQINAGANIYVQERREALQIEEMKLSVLKHEDNKVFQAEIARKNYERNVELATENHRRNLEIQRYNQEFQEKMAQLSHENQQKLEEYRAMVQFAVQDKNINFQKWKLEEEKVLQLQIINSRQDFEREIAKYNRETALNTIREQRKLANFPIDLVPDHLLESHYRDGTMPLQILLSPPELNYDSFGQQSFGFKIENQLAEELRQFLDAYYPFNAKKRQTELIDGTWVSKKFRGGGGIKALFSQLKAVPIMVLESEVDSNYLNFRVAYWRGDGGEYQYKTILSSFPYRDFLYDSVRERARQWQAMKQLLSAKGKTPEMLKAIGGDNEFNLFILQEEQQLLNEGFDLSNSDIHKQYKVSEKDFQKLHKYLIACHCLTASLIADVHYLAPGNNLTPLLPTLLQDLLKDIPESDELQTTMLDWLLTIYNQMYEKLEEVMAGWIPDLILKFAIVLTSLEDKSYAIQQGEQSVKAWLRLYGMKVVERNKLHSIVTKDDEPYFKNLQEFLEKVGTTDGLTEAKSLLEAWLILNDLGVVKDSPKVNVDDVPKPEPPKPELPGEEFSFEVVTVNSSGEIINKETKTNRQQIFDLGGGVKLEMVYIPAGSFMMGAPANEKGSNDSERPQHNVTLEAFWMAKYPITQAQYRAITGNNPSRFTSDNNNPVEQVSPDNALDFCQKLSVKLGKQFQLPSEAQWEYACRAGTTAPFYFGETITGNLANYNASNTYANESSGTYRGTTTPVGSFSPNALGLYDMHGNVWEWCADIWHDNYDGAPTDGSAWVSGRESNTFVLRGGSWDNDPDNCRSAYRNRNAHNNINNNNGFRCIAVVLFCVKIS